MKTRTFVVVLGALLLVSVTSAAGASAHTWKLNGLEITKARPFKATANVVFEMRKYHERNECAFKETGTVGPGSAGTITAVTSPAGAKVFECRQIEGTQYPCSSHIQVEARDLPWQTELTTVGGVLRNTIKSTNEPEWHITCKGSRGEVSMKCLANTNTGMVNRLYGVEAVFDASSPEDACDIGFLRYQGHEEIESAEGRALQLSVT